MHRDLLDRRIDVLIGWKVGPLADARLAFDVLYNDTHVVVAGAANRWRKRRRIELAELMEEPWVLPSPDSFIGSVILQAFRAHGLDWPRATVLTFPHDVRTRLLATGRFLTIFRGSVVQYSGQPPELAALPVDLGIENVPMGVATLAKRTRSPVTQLFVRHARDVAKRMR
jgi:DNA-binding transcriptional LysR family regulator